MRNNGERIFSAVHIRNQYFICTPAKFSISSAQLCLHSSLPETPLAEGGSLATTEGWRQRR